MNLIELVEAGDVPGVLRELGVLSTERRADYAADLFARYEAMDRSEWLACINERKISTAWGVAELAGQTTPESAAVWLTTFIHRSPDCGTMADIANLYPVEWRVELVARLAEQAEIGPNPWFRLAEHIIRDTGCPIPTSDAFTDAWLCDRVPYRLARERPERVLGGARGHDLLERLRNDDFAPTLLPLAVQRPAVRIGPHRKEFLQLAAKGVIDRDTLSRRTAANMLRGTPVEEDALKALAGDPLTSAEHARLADARHELVEPLIARLLQDGTRAELAESLTDLRTLAPTPDENAGFLRDHVAMLDLSTPVAGYGQEVLIGLDEAGLLEADVLTEACERVLLRPEKKLVRAQLSWLDRVARRDPARVGRVLTDAAAVLQHPDVALQERALNLIARHLRSVGEEVLPELRAAADGINPGLAVRAAELLGLSQEAGAEQYTEILPPVPEPRAVPGPVETVAEVAQEVAVVLADDWDVVPFERALDGLVRHSRIDREALSEALAPVVRRAPSRFRGNYTQVDLYDVAAAVRGDQRRDWHIDLRGSRPVSPHGRMLLARLSETIEVIESGSQPFLLAVPTLATGAIDAAVLVERIAEFERLGVTPAPVDLAQALLRVDPAPGEQVQRAAEKLESDAGGQLAQWLRDGGLEHQDSTPQGWPTSRSRERWHPAHPGLASEPSLPPVAAALVGPQGFDALASDEDAEPFWAAQLPHHSDEVVARSYEMRPPHVLPFIVEFCAPAGFAVHWAIADCVERGSAGTGPDALLMLAARGRLDTGLLGEQLQETVACEGESAKGVADSLRVAAETGAYATVWSVLEAALPGLLGETPVRGAGALLALATECASRCGAKGAIAEVDAVAARKGSTQTIKNARLLRDVLH